MILGNDHVIFLHIQIEYLKCEFWEFESTQKDLWLIFNKCLKLPKCLQYYFYCMRSKINLRLRPILLVRYFDQLSVEIWFTNFGSVDIFELNFEQGLWIISRLKRKKAIWIKTAGGKARWARRKNKWATQEITNGPSQLSPRAGLNEKKMPQGDVA